MSEIPTGLTFVNPDETDPTYRVCLWAAPGAGKSVAAATAPGPILVVTADRPSAYRFARKKNPGKDIREVRYTGAETLEEVYRYLRAEDCDVKTVVIDPFSHVYDALVDAAPAGRDGTPDYQGVNKKLLKFLKSLRTFDVNVVLVAHEKLNDGKSGDGKMYPALGGPSLINKVLAEMDVVAHIGRVVQEGKEPVWVGQIQPVQNLVTKDSTDALGDRRVADLSRWFEVANEALAPDDSDLPEGLRSEDEAVAAVIDGFDATEEAA